jgi:hypothetical protein
MATLRNHLSESLAQQLQYPATIMIPCCFAIIPDRSHQPLAMFADLQDAMDWGLKRLGGDSFRIKYISVARVDREDDGAAASADEKASEEDVYEESSEEALLARPRLVS